MPRTGPVPLSCPKFHVDTRVQVGDLLRDLLPNRNNVTRMAITLSYGGEKAALGGITRMGNGQGQSFY
jgi:hypothetical protein